jgi:hypothetical protein
VMVQGICRCHCGNSQTKRMSTSDLETLALVVATRGKFEQKSLGA